VIRVEDAYRIYETEGGGVAALQGLTLTVEQGEIVVVLGPSGSGKTTLLRVLAGLEHLSAGRAAVLGEEVSRLDAGRAAAFRAANVGLLDQHYAQSLSPDLTCGQTVSLQLELLGRPRREARVRAGELLARVGLGGRGRERPATLSGGEQQRVALCAAVAHSPRLLLADEPAGELDAANAELVYRLLGDLVRDSRATAVVVSHDRAAASIADRLVHVRDGRVVEQANPRGEPALVVGGGGWIRLPEPLLRGLGKPRLLAAAPAGDGVVLTAAAPAVLDADGAGPEPAVRPTGRAVAELRRVGKRYGDRTVLDGLSRSFRAGALTAVVGRSGSGKTTLLHLLAGLLRPSEGEVLLAGEPIHALSRSRLAALRRENVALVTQEPGLVPYLTALENVELALDLRRRSGDARRALAEVGLEERLDARAARLSAGERQRVAIARALAVEAPLLLADEPTARLDEENARAAGTLLAAAARERGVAVVCATHDEVLIELADEAVLLDHSTSSASVGA
jgi:ABC-type lipoprotein export system ATPase subunit